MPPRGPGRRARQLTLIAGAWAFCALGPGCGIRGPPRPANAPPVNPGSLQQESPGREFPSRSPFEGPRPPAQAQPQPDPRPLPDGGMSPFHP